MKTIGLIGGMSWESSAAYYRIINETVKERLGGLHSARCIMYSAEFAEIEALQHQGAWGRLTSLMIDYARRIEGAGADCIVICTNTMHKMADEVQESIAIPILHIADAAGKEAIAKGLRTVVLLGTSFTMEEDFYKKRLREAYTLEVLIPAAGERELIDRVIYKELCLGILNDSSREDFKKIIKKLTALGAEGVILGCTEIPLLLAQEDVEIPILDTTSLHARAAVEFALA
jgi:aspartate racemase